MTNNNHTINIIIGPPSNPDDCHKMMSDFLSKHGKHIVCGGTTSRIAAKHLNKPVVSSFAYNDPSIPPTAQIDGVDLVTEGSITIKRVLEYAKDFIHENRMYDKWKIKSDGASEIAKLLFENTSHVNIFVGRAVNPSHQNSNFPINFDKKMKIIDELSQCLVQMGKEVHVSYF